jgi:GntR family transcriptional regulator, transcriptional repressor for pyruvate dehydrogenase complex
MTIEIAHSKLSDQIVLRLACEIVRGTLSPGDNLGSEPELAGSLGVSKPVVRESFRDLASLGLIRVQHGKRTLVQDPSEWNVLDPMVQEAFRIEGRGPELEQQLYELRMILETSSAERAARRGTREQIAEITGMAAHLRQIATDTNDRDEFLRVDREFHDAIAKASANEALRQVIRNVHTFLTLNWTTTSITGVELDELAGLHEAIADAIAAGDAEGARAAMGRHLQHAADSVLNELAAPEGPDVA